MLFKPLDKRVMRTSRHLLCMILLAKCDVSKSGRKRKESEKRIGDLLKPKLARIGEGGNDGGLVASGTSVQCKPLRHMKYLC